MKSTVNMFSIKVDRFKLTNIDNDMLVNYALDMKNKLQTISGPVIDSSWQSEDIRLHESEKFKSFYSIYENKLNQVYHTSYNKNYKVKISLAWCSVRNHEEITKPHYHKESFLSAVYYPQAHNEELQFLNPNPQLFGLTRIEYVEKHDEYNSEYWHVRVDTGDLLVFNSMLYHYIKPTNKQRISFAIDSIIVPN